MLPKFSEESKTDVSNLPYPLKQVKQAQSCRRRHRSSSAPKENVLAIGIENPFGMPINQRRERIIPLGLKLFHSRTDEEEEELRQVEEEDMAKSSSDEEEDEDKVFKLSEAVKKRKKMERQMKRAQEKVKRLVEKKQLEDQNQESKACFTSDGRPILG